MTTGSSAAPEPLAGARIVELGGGVATRYCGRLLARLGADVRQVDVNRATDEWLGHGGESGRVFGRWLDERKSDAPVSEGAGGSADVVLVGQDAETVASAEARLSGSSSMLLALTWFGTTGPYSSWRGTDEIVHALAGLAHSFGPPEGPPTLARSHGPQIMAGANAANLVLATLLLPRHRRPSRLDVNVFESTMCLSEVGAVGALDDPAVISTRLGVNRYSPTYPCSSYRTSDGWAGVTCLTPAQWLALCHLIGRTDLVAEKRFSTSFRRLMRGDEVDAVLEPAFLERTTDEWVGLGITHRIPIAPMPTPGALPSQEHWRDRGAFAAVAGGTVAGGTIVAPTLPFRWSTDGQLSDNQASEAASSSPLTGVRVVDFSMGWAGPQATRYLGDLGADVVKVESATHPDWYRGWEADLGGDPPPIELRSNFNTLNRNKRGVALELTEPDGLAAAKSLVATADVVIENFAYGVLAKLGLGADELRRIRPGLVRLTMPAFGDGGPLSPIRAYGSTVEQASGLPFVNGRESWPPSLQHVAYGDAVAGIYAVTAILSGLHNRPTSGGSDVDLAQVACLFEIGADAIVAEQVTGQPVQRSGNRRGGASVCCVVPGAAVDTWLAVIVEAADATATAALAGVLGLAEDTDEDAIEAALSAWAGLRAPAEAAAQLQCAGIAAAPVQPVHATGHDPHLVATGFWETLERRYVGTHALGAPPFRIDGMRPIARRPAPTLGEHTAEVLAEVGFPIPSVGA